MEVRRVHLANWAHWTLPKFTRVVKYQFHQGFLADQRSENPNHPLPPSNTYHPLLIPKLHSLELKEKNSILDRDLNPGL